MGSSSKVCGITVEEGTFGALDTRWWCTCNAARGGVRAAGGAPGRIRTCGLELRRLLLYPLSYGRWKPDHRIRPPTPDPVRGHSEPGCDLSLTRSGEAATMPRTTGEGRRWAVTQAFSPPGSWAGGDRYEADAGGGSPRGPRRFVASLAVPAGARWLDVGCGTGALSETVLAAAEPSAVLGVDPSPDFVAHAAAHVTDPRAAFREGSAQTLPADDAAFDAVVSGLVLNFVPDPAAALAEMRRVARPDGIVAAYVWDYAGGMQLMRRFWDAAAELDPAVRDLDEGLRFPLCRPEPLRELFTDAGLGDVEVEEIVVPTVFADFDDYWTPFLGGTGPAPAYAAHLPEHDRAALREGLRSLLPARPDGSIHLSARAWSARGWSHRGS